MTWTSAITELQSWLANPLQFDADDCDPPTPATILRAVHFARARLEMRAPGPGRVIAGISGCVIFEFHAADFKAFEEIIVPSNPLEKIRHTAQCNDAVFFSEELAG